MGNTIVSANVSEIRKKLSIVRDIDIQKTDVKSGFV